MKDEDRAALAVPAVYVNRIHGVFDGEAVRIAFAEGVGGDMTTLQFRVAVSMSLANATALLGLLADVVRVAGGGSPTLHQVEGAKCH